MLLLVVYDIADNKRRVRLAHFLEGYGRRVQESVFEYFVPLSEVKKVFEQVKRRVKESEDNVRFYWIPSDALPKSLTIGCPLPCAPPSVYII
jgi:CRISPR-associated protein Cas2